MANILDWNILDHRVRAYLDPQSGIDNPQKAFPVLMVASILDVTDEEAEDAITDGSNDRGVDAIFVDDRDGKNTIHVFQFKYVISFEKSKDNFPSGEIDKIISFFLDVLDENKGMETTCNSILWNKVREVWTALNKPSPLIEVHFCGNMKEMVDSEKERANNSFEKYRYFNVKHHSLDSIVDFFVDKKRPALSRRLTVVDKDYFDRTDGNIRGLICTVEASEIVKMITDPANPGQVLNEIFNDNVRIYLTRNNKINKRIIDTALSEENSLFWYLNNGITITCDSFSYPKGKRAPVVELNRVQIVNGGQTSNALFEAALCDAKKLEDVLVLVRIIETKSQQVSLAIAESTNSQTPIKGRDLRSNDDIQKKIEEAFSGIGLFYERKYNQFQDQPNLSRVDALIAGQAHLAYGLEFPEVAKKDRGRIFADLYDTIFTDKLTVDDLYVPFRLLQKIEKVKKNIQKSIRDQSYFDMNNMYLIDGAYHVLFAMGQICDIKGENRLNFPFAESKIDEAITLVALVVQDEQKKDETFSFNRFFKDTKSKIKIATYIQSRYR